MTEDAQCATGSDPNFVPNSSSERFDLMRKIGQRVEHCVKASRGVPVYKDGNQAGDELREIAQQTTDEIDVLLTSSQQRHPIEADERTPLHRSAMPTPLGLEVCAICKQGDHLSDACPRRSRSPQCLFCVKGECNLCKGKRCGCECREAKTIGRPHGFGDKPAPTFDSNCVRDDVLIAMGEVAGMIVEAVPEAAGVQLDVEKLMEIAERAAVKVCNPLYEVKSESGALALVQKQSNDEGIWFNATSAPEAYLQQALRSLHRAVEGKT